jgi:hypothetical protein
MDALARLRIVENGVIAVDLMFGFEIVGIGSGPMPLDHCPCLAISALKLEPLAAVLAIDAASTDSIAGSSDKLGSKIRVVLCVGAV